MKHADDLTGDRFTPKPGVYDSADCGVCQTKMTVRHNVNGPTGFAEGVGGFSHLHDEFTCPHNEEKWHIQAKVLKEKAAKSASKRIEDILLEEAAHIVLTRTETKDIGSGLFYT